MNDINNLCKIKNKNKIRITIDIHTLYKFNIV